MTSTTIPLGRKLNFATGAMLASVIVLSGLCFYTQQQMKSRFDHAVERTVKKITLADDINTAESDLLAAQRGSFMYTFARHDEKAEAAIRAFGATAAKVETAFRDLKPLLEKQAAKDAVANLEKDLATWKTTFREIEGLLKEHKMEEALKLANAIVIPIHDRMGAEASKLRQSQEQNLADDQQAMSSLTSTVFWMNIVLAILFAVVGAFAFYTIATANRSLRGIAGEISAGADQVASAAGQVSSSSQSLAQGSSQQAASLEETSASTEEINSMTQKNAENAQAASKETATADVYLKETVQRLDQMIVSMGEINGSSEKISKIIKVIDEIAFQTNILALNAAVEAARAGEAGMGFAVVADEVRNLAQRCAQAAKDTSELIEESIAKSKEGKGKLDQVAESIAKVTDNAAKIKILSNEVHVGSQEQARGIEQIAKAITQMQQVTQGTAASAEEGASAGEEMSSQAEALKNAVSRLSDLVGTDEREQTSSAAYHRPGGHSASLANLTRKVSTRTNAPAPHGGRIPAAVKSSAPSFPADDDFKDF